MTSAADRLRTLADQAMKRAHHYVPRGRDDGWTDPDTGEWVSMPSHVRAMMNGEDAERLLVMHMDICRWAADAADALDNLAVEVERHFIICRSCGALAERPETALKHSERCEVAALLARLEHITGKESIGQ